MDISEEIVSGAYQTLGYFVISGKKVGFKEIDLLAVYLGNNGRIKERIHVEVQISVTPVGVLRDKPGLGTSGQNPRASARAYIKKKFLDPRVIASAQEAFGTKNYSRAFVYGNINKPEQLKEFRRHHIQCLPIQALIAMAQANSPVASFKRVIGIAQILSLPYESWA